jgi:hypothetical protein
VSGGYCLRSGDRRRSSKLKDQSSREAPNTKLQKLAA